MTTEVQQFPVISLHSWEHVTTYNNMWQHIMATHVMAHGRVWKPATAADRSRVSNSIVYYDIA